MTVQLGPLEVAAESLNRQLGKPMDAALGEIGISRTAKPLCRDMSVPEDGWRLVSDKSEEDGRVVWIAAPVGPGWQLVSFDWAQRRWSAHPYPGVVTPVRNRRARSAGLKLQWPSRPLRWKRGTTPELMIELMNQGDRAFPDTDLDNTLVVAWILDTRTASKLPSVEGFASSPLNHRQPILPGQSRMLPVKLLTLNPDQLDAGLYDIEAMLQSVQLETTGQAQIVGNEVLHEAD